MSISKFSRKKGSLFTLVLLIIAMVIVLGYFGINVQRDVIGNSTVQNNFTYLYDQVKWFWNTYLEDLAIRLWQWTIVNVTNLPVGSGNGIQIPQVLLPIDIWNLPNPLDVLNTTQNQTQVIPATQSVLPSQQIQVQNSQPGNNFNL